MIGKKDKKTVKFAFLLRIECENSSPTAWKNLEIDTYKTRTNGLIAYVLFANVYRVLCEYSKIISTVYGIFIAAR